MNWKALLNGALTAAVSGGAMATAQIVLDPLHFQWKVTGTVFAGGAVIGLLNWLRTSPWQPQA